MFDLEREVADWSAAAYAGGCRSGASVAELSDHLYCEVDRARAEGMSDEAAFAAAIAKVGPATKLAAEHAKNRSWLARVCAWDARMTGIDRAEQRWLLVAHAFIWGTLMISTALLLKRSESKMLAYMITGIYVPMWLASEQILRRAMRRKRTDRPR